METLFNDLRFAVIQLRKTPGLAVIATITLALGLGANTAIFTVCESVLLRPLPYANAKRLVNIGPADGDGFANTSWLNYRDIRDQSRQLAAVASYSGDIGVVTHGDTSESIVSPRLSTNLISMLGAQPLLGRVFNDADGLPGSPVVALLSEGLWREGFHADQGIIGKTIKVDGKTAMVVGVMHDSFRFPEQARSGLQKAVWLPIQPTHEMLNSRGYHFLNIIAELAPGVTIAQAQKELDSIAAHIPKSDPGDKFEFRIRSYQEVLTGSVRPVLFALFGALGLVLLIACANVSNLLIARCLGRQQEFAVRAALGASRARLMRQLLSEGLMLSLLGCGVGVLIAELAMVAARKLPEGTMPRADTISIDWMVVLALGSIAVLTTLLSSLVPALLVAQANPQSALQAASRGVGSRAASGKLSGWLVAGEVALSTLLLVVTGLLFHTIWNLEQARLGFDATHLTTFTAIPEKSAGFSSMAVSADTDHAPTSDAILIYQPLLDRMRSLPGVESAALMSSPPFSGLQVGTGFSIVGDAKDPSKQDGARISAVSGDYARAMGTPILRGRMIEDGDGATMPYVVVINEALAKKYFAGRDPVGRQLDLGGKDTGMLRPYTVVGVLADQVDANVGGEVEPLIFVPQAQVPTTSLFYQALLETVVSFVVKTRGAIPVANQMRPVFHELAPGYALDDFQTMQDSVDNNTFSRRLGLYLVGSFAGLAIAMVVTGLYGVLSQLVSYRRREIGVRMALGATRLNVVQMILRQGSFLIGAGMIAGLMMAFAATQMIKGFLYEVPALDVWTYVSVALALTLIGLAASFIPARRAASIQPMEALRTE